MLPTKEQAETILNEAVKVNPAPWESHCKVAAMYAEKIASKCKNMMQTKLTS